MPFNWPTPIPPLLELRELDRLYEFNLFNLACLTYMSVCYLGWRSTEVYVAIGLAAVIIAVVANVTRSVL